MAPGGRRGGGGGGGKGGGGRGGSGGSGTPQDRDKQLSKALSTLLRHQAGNAGIELDGEGFARLDQVLKWPRLANLKPRGVGEVRRLVRESDKQRFLLKRRGGGGDEEEKKKKKEGENEQEEEDDDNEDPKNWLIRANQGHSIKLASESLHTPITLERGNVPEVVVHGTYFAFWDKIVEAGGLKRMGRTHVHFGTGLPAEDSLDNGGGNDQQKGGGKQQQVHEVADEEKEAEAEDREKEEEQEKKEKEETEGGGDKGKGGKKGKGAKGAAAAAGKPPGKGGVISGMRSDAELLVFVDVARSLRESSSSNNGSTTTTTTAAAAPQGEGSVEKESDDKNGSNGPMKWWLSDNGVVLTEGEGEEGLVPLRYVSEVRGRRQGVGVLWRDGEKVADLPEGTVIKVPFGKNAAGGRWEKWRKR